MELYNFEEFKAVGGRGRPSFSGIHLSRTGITYTKKFVEGKPKLGWVSLRFDASKEVIGVKFVSDKQDGSFRVRFNDDMAAHTSCKISEKMPVGFYSWVETTREGFEIFIKQK